jgi:hypothetical protein
MLVPAEAFRVPRVIFWRHMLLRTPLRGQCGKMDITIEAIEDAATRSRISVCNMCAHQRRARTNRSSARHEGGRSGHLMSDDRFHREARQQTQLRTSGDETAFRFNERLGKPRVTHADGGTSLQGRRSELSLEVGTPARAITGARTVFSRVSRSLHCGRAVNFWMSCFLPPSRLLPSPTSFQEEKSCVGGRVHLQGEQTNVYLTNRVSTRRGRRGQEKVGNSLRGAHREQGCMCSSAWRHGPESSMACPFSSLALKSGATCARGEMSHT